MSLSSSSAFVSSSAVCSSSNSSAANTYIYRLIGKAEWEEALKKGFYEGGDLDSKTGFIHLSQGSEVGETCRIFFVGRADVLLLEIPVRSLPGDALRWEVCSFDQLHINDLYDHALCFLTCFLCRQLSHVIMFAFLICTLD